ncbi:two component transcriptional regulator, winged helix family [Thermaerobacter marianensis DSM 12885]|uniref:Stage 0 sporulation protein A homolog n=1 Tax=Thermaerobacter marianensis (strain ATCC 700841 / DSM 12885 / JCM 10246 / 7p75a) TaxID=644966 RepID=E6SH60_THEM7|nr:response regulator transcription factor [Thermaerobacter marianensis]ADU51724.1 two component transcriptional regulator, winged helix family [Thermaerobacter marianensis DSM 12885]
MTRATILIVDDEPDLTRLLAEHLEREGFVPLVAHDGETALRLLDDTPCHLAILDIMLPGMDGIDLLRRIRDPRRPRPDLPVIMLSAKDSPVDKTVGLSLGADDYVGKPFSLLELTARIHAVLRRAGYRHPGPAGRTPAAVAAPPEAARSGTADPGAGPGAGSQPAATAAAMAVTGRPPYPAAAPHEAGHEGEVVRCGPLTLDLAAARVWVDGKPVSLTAKEYQLLAWWVRHPDRVFTKQQIYEAVWGEPYVADDNTVAVHIHRLRAKIERNPERPAIIQTVRGLGYRLVCGP